LNDSFKRNQRSRPKVPHGKIGFESLAKVIGQRWQRLNAEQMNHYKDLAMKEMIRYKEAMMVFREENASNPDASAAPRTFLDSVDCQYNESLTAIEENDKCPSNLA
jgi:hypothetical protein